MISNSITGTLRRARNLVSGLAVAGLLVGTLVTGGCATANGQDRSAAVQTAASIAVTQAPQTDEARAVQELRALHDKGKLERLFKRNSKTGAYVNAAEHDLFSRLPVIGPDVTPQQLVDFGLIDAIPKGLEILNERPQYFEGRQVFVKTSTSGDRSGGDWGKYEAGGRQRISHLGRLVGMQGDNFEVEVPTVAGGKHTVTVTRDELLHLNQPSSPASTNSEVNWVEINYEDPIARAKIALGFFEIEKLLAKLDFSDPKNDKANEKIQLAIVKKLQKLQDSEYSKAHHEDWQRIHTMINVHNGGVGVCTIQGTTQWGYAQPFEGVGGFTLQNLDGGTIDDDSGHNFSILRLLGTMKPFVTDKTWGSANAHVPLDEAMRDQGHNRNRYMARPGDRAPGDLDVPQGAFAFPKD